jgi:hypothetical protein
MKKYKERFLLKITLSLGKTVGDALIFNFCLPPSRASLFFTGSIVILQIGHIKKKNKYTNLASRDVAADMQLCTIKNSRLNISGINLNCLCRKERVEVEHMLDDRM